MSDIVTKCEGSGTVQMVDWYPDDTEAFDGKPYPGASVCIYCSYGVLLIRGSIHKAISGSGREGSAGKLRVHYIKEAFVDELQARDITSMAYSKKELRDT